MTSRPTRVSGAIWWSTEPVIAAELRRGLAAQDRSARAAGGETDDETRRRLAALGYLGGGAPTTADRLADPKEKIASRSADLRRGFDHYRRGEAALAVPAFEAALAENPGHHRRLGVSGALPAPPRAAGGGGRPPTAGRWRRAATRPICCNGLAAVELDRGQVRARPARLLAQAGSPGRAGATADAPLWVSVWRRAGRRQRTRWPLLRPLADGRGHSGDERTRAHTFRGRRSGGGRGSSSGRLLVLEFPPTPRRMRTWGSSGSDSGAGRRHARRRRASARSFDAERAEAWNNLGVALYSTGQQEAKP